MTTLIIGTLFGMALLLAGKTLTLTIVGKTVTCQVTEQRTQTSTSRSGLTYTYIHAVSCPGDRDYEISTSTDYRHSTGPAAVVYGPNNLFEPDFARRPSATQGLIWLSGTSTAMTALVAFAFIRRYHAAGRAIENHSTSSGKHHRP